MDDIFSQVLNMSLTGSVVILCVMAVRLLLKRSPKIFSYALWAVVLFRLLCPVSLPSPVSLLEVAKPQVAKTSGATSTVSYLPVEYVNTQRQLLLQTDDPAQETVRSDTVPARAVVTPVTVASWVWLAGIGLMVVSGGVDYLRLRRRLVGAVLYRGEVYLADHIVSPFAMGILRPRIYLPTSVPVKERRFIIAHERHHIRRGDHIIKLLAYAALCIHWFNPLVWAAFLLAGKDMEMSCDEAVIRKLGDHIRADYAASLLRLATGRKVISGTPLSFGEGDPKGRIRNMARWKKPKAWVSAVCILVCIAVLAACAVNPEKGGEDVPAETEAADTGSVTIPPEETVPDPQVPYLKEFTSNDGRVNVRMDLTAQETGGIYPVVEVVPHFLSQEEVRRAAYAIFGEDVEFYECEPTLTRDRKLSRSELQALLDRYAPYTDPEALLALDGVSKEALDESSLEFYREMAADVEESLQEYTRKLETAPEENPRPVCQWTYHKESHYFYDQDDPAMQSIDYEQRDAIEARVTVEGIPYIFSAQTQNSVYKDNFIHVYINDYDNPRGLGDAVFGALLCRTAEPTREQADAAAGKAEAILSKLNLGRWAIDKCYVYSSEPAGDLSDGTSIAYTICVEAVPELNGVPVINRGEFGAADGDNYGSPWAEFRFAPGGTLLSLTLNAPVDMTQVISEGGTSMEIGALLESAEAYLREADAHGYSMYQSIAYQNPDDLWDVEITEMRHGLSRTRVRSGEAVYRYVPSVILYGTVSCKDAATGRPYIFSSGTTVCLVLNAMDGSVLDTF